MAENSTTIRQSRYFAGVTPAELYAAFLDGKKHSRMTGGAAKCVAKEGGAFSAWDGYISGVNLKLDPDRTIVQTWQTTEWPEAAPPSRLRWSFAVEKEGTRVTLTHSKVPPSQIESYRQGWIDFYWSPMARYFSR